MAELVKHRISDIKAHAMGLAALDFGQ